MLLPTIGTSLRSLIRQRHFLFIAVCTLALGIGSATAIFSVIESVLLRELPYGNPHRLVMVWETEATSLERAVAGANFLDWRKQSDSFEGLTAFFPKAVTVTGVDRAERLEVLEVTGDFFDVFGVEAHVGRAFASSDAVEPKTRTLVVSYDYWQRAWGGDPSWIGRTVRLDDTVFNVIGVAPAGFQIPFEEADGWIRADAKVPPPPMNIPEPETVRGLHWLRVVGRLSEGVSLAEAQSEMDLIGERLAEAYPEDNAGRGIRLVPLQEQVVGEARPGLLILLGSVGCLLLIGCANVANLLLARAAGRQREIALRSALGASRARILGELLIEATLLSMLGGALGLVVATFLTQLAVRLSPLEVFRMDLANLNPVVLGFAILLSLVTGIVFGIFPALVVSKPDLQTSLKEGGRSSSVRAGKRLRAGLVVAELALSLVLLVGAGLLMKSFLSLTNVEPGFEPQRLLTLRVSLPETRYQDNQKIVAAYEAILDELSRLPGSSGASAVLGVPLSGVTANFGVEIEGRLSEPGEELESGFQSVAPGYFRTMAIPLIRGRDVSASDTQDTTGVVVINQTAAKRFWPGEDAIGKRLTYDDGVTYLEVVGIVGDVLHTGLDKEPRAETFAPMQQAPFPFMTLVLSARGEPEALTRQAEAAIRTVDPELPVYRVMTMEAVMAESVARPRFHTVLLGLFATAAMLLAAVGIYGVMATIAGARLHEMGIRRALGARGRDVMALILGQALGLAGIGLALGMLGAFALTRLVESMLFQVSRTDPLVYGGVCLILLVTAVAASLLPAYRASRVDPLQALHHE